VAFRFPPDDPCANLVVAYDCVGGAKGEAIRACFDKLAGILDERMNK
jgi:hypothetical protein